uniref:Uncharacterized protein n=1 Tax=Glossina brevipalpis TaxID=37001 RepID=A0A1A9VZE1_9MUSC
MMHKHVISKCTFWENQKLDLSLNVGELSHLKITVALDDIKVSAQEFLNITATNVVEEIPQNLYIYHQNPFTLELVFHFAATLVLIISLRILCSSFWVSNMRLNPATL